MSKSNVLDSRDEAPVQVSDRAYLDRLIYRLLMPLAATTERETVALQREAAQMLHLMALRKVQPVQPKENK